jgi:hypothetical protein
MRSRISHFSNRLETENELLSRRSGTIKKVEDIALFKQVRINI